MASPEATPVQIVILRCLDCQQDVETAEMFVGSDGHPIYRKVESLLEKETRSYVCAAKGKGQPHTTARTQGTGK